MASLSYLERKARKLQLEKADPSLKGGLSYADVESRIPNADSRRQESILMQERDAAQLRERNAAQLRERNAAQLRERNATQQGGNAPVASPSGQSVFTGVAGRKVGFSNGASASFSGSLGNAASSSESFAETDARKRRESTITGAFGSGAQDRLERSDNISQRQGLFAEMKSGSIDFAQARERATALGVSDKGFNSAVARIKGGGMDAANAAPVEPISGRALAQKNLSEMGAVGAAQDYFKRADADKAALQKQKNTNFAEQALKASGDKTPSPLSFASSFASEIDAPDITLSPAPDTGKAQRIRNEEFAGSALKAASDETPSPLAFSSGDTPYESSDIAYSTTPTITKRPAPQTVGKSIRRNAQAFFGPLPERTLQQKPGVTNVRDMAAVKGIGLAADIFKKGYTEGRDEDIKEYDKAPLKSATVGTVRGLKSIFSGLRGQNTRTTKR